MIIKNVRDLPDIKKNLTLAQIKTHIIFDEKILCAGLVMTLDMELAITERLATEDEIEQYALEAV